MNANEERVKKCAEEGADFLLQDCERLALKKRRNADTDEEVEMGGYCRIAIVQFLEAIIQRHFEEAEKENESLRERIQIATRNFRDGAVGIWWVIDYLELGISNQDPTNKEQPDE